MFPIHVCAHKKTEFDGTFQVREICQDMPFCSDKHFTKNSMLAFQEAAENFVTETFHKADMARFHSGRDTLHVKVHVMFALKHSLPAQAMLDDLTKLPTGFTLLTLHDA